MNTQHIRRWPSLLSGGPLVRAAALAVTLFASTSAYSALFVVSNTDDNGAGSLRAALTAANADLDADTIQFAIPGIGPHTIIPVTALPMITAPLILDGYTQAGASPNTLSLGDDAVLNIVIRAVLTIDTTNSIIRGLAIDAIRVGDQPGINGSNAIEGNFIGLDATGTQSLGHDGSGLFVQTPNNRIGGLNVAARNIISGHGTTGIEIFGEFAHGTIVLGNYIGTDRTATRAIGNKDRALVVNTAAYSTAIGGTSPGAGNVISGNLDRGITLDGNTNIVLGNWIGTDGSGSKPLGNARTGVEIGGIGNIVGGLAAGSGNIIAFNGVAGPEGSSTNGVDVKPQTPRFAILGNAIFDNAGLGIDIDMDNSITPGAPEITSVQNTALAATVRGIYQPSSPFRLELFQNEICNPSGSGEGKVLVRSEIVTTDAAGHWSLSMPTPFPPEAILTATADGMTEFSKCYFITMPGKTNRWTSDSDGRWEEATNWSLGFAPFGTLQQVLVTNAGTKTLLADNVTATRFAATLVLSNLLIRAPWGATNRLVVSDTGATPLRVWDSLQLKSGGALVLSNSALQMDGPLFGQLSVDGDFDLWNSDLNANDPNKVVLVGNIGPGRLTTSNATVSADRMIIGANVGGDGLFQLTGGIATIHSAFDIADDQSATGRVVVTSGRLNLATIYVGLFGTGTFEISDGSVQCDGAMDIASQDGATGAFLATGGLSRFGSILLAESPLADGLLRVSGIAQVECLHLLQNNGTLALDGGTLIAGQLGGSVRSQFVIGGGTLLSSNTSIANGQPFVVGDSNRVATFRIEGGAHTFPDGLRISPNAVLTGNGIVTASVQVSGAIAPGSPVGRIDVSKDLSMTANAETRIELGGYMAGTEHDYIQIAQAGRINGKLVVTFAIGFADRITNGASFGILTAGTLSGAYTNLFAPGRVQTADGLGDFRISYGASAIRLSDFHRNPNADTDGDGLPDTYEDANGFDKHNPADALQDADGDGFSNLAEYLAGTNPRVPQSNLRITDLHREGNDIRITWITARGRTNQLQVATNLNRNNFVDLGAALTTPGAGDFTNNQVDAGGATQGRMRYYRVKLVP